MKRNNVNLYAIATLADRLRADPAAVRVQRRVEGTWHLDDGSPQFTATVAHGEHASVLQGDLAASFGGSGLAPDPLQYMLFGLAACYTATVVTIASTEGVDLRAVHAVAENSVDVSRVFGIGDGPLVDRVSVRVAVSGAADDAQLARWAAAARERCPFAFTIAHAIALETRVERT